MKKILILLLIQILPAYCLATTTNNDSFKMYIEAISLNNQISKNYSIFDATPLMIRDYPHIKNIYYDNVITYLKNELEKQNYKVLYMDAVEIPNSIQADKISTMSIYYTMVGTKPPYKKCVIINAGNDKLLPLWSLMLIVQDESFKFQYYIPSMIKCAGKYFNKNFKGVVTCKR